MKIAIVGAGIGGIHLAYLLKKYGAEVTILDQASEVGGKIKSIKDEQGHVHEMGACYLSPEYTSTYSLIHELDLSDQLIPVPARVVFLPDGSKVTFKKWMLSEIKKTNRWYALLPKPILYLWLLHKMRIYCRLHRKLFKNETKNIFLTKLPLSVLEQLSVNFSHFLLDKKLEILCPLFQLFQSAQGYGYLKLVPAYYGLFWCTPKTLQIFKSQMSPLSKVKKGIQTTPFLFGEGFQQFAKKLFASSKARFIPNVKVVKTERVNENKKIYVSYKDVKSGEITKMEVDKVVLACNLRDSLEFLDATHAEHYLFNNLSCYSFVTSIVSGSHKDEDMIHSWPYRIEPTLEFYPFTQRYTKLFYPSTNEPITEMANARVTYQLGLEQNFDKEVITTLCTTRISEIADDVKVLYTWYGGKAYFPHYSAYGLLNQMPWRIFDLQGSNHTLYTGASAAFESVESIINYNLLLEREKFKLWGLGAV